PFQCVLIPLFASPNPLPTATASLSLHDALPISDITAGPDGKLYCAPFEATNILVIDPIAGTAQRTNMGANLSGSQKWIGIATGRSEEHTSELQSRENLVCRLLLEKKKGAMTQTL